jgi:hypothetical protein
MGQLVEGGARSPTSLYGVGNRLGGVPDRAVAWTASLAWSSLLVSAVGFRGSPSPIISLAPFPHQARRKLSCFDREV